MFLYENYYNISNNLLEMHEIFYKFWTIGRPVFTKKIPTAAVTFNIKSGDFLQFLFNPDFWKKLDDYEKCFVIAHECLHVILNHGLRIKNSDKNISACAIDLVVNNILTNNLGFKLTPTLLQGVHFKNFFIDESKVLKNKSYEYYYSLIKENKDNINQDIMNNINNHDYLTTIDYDELMDYIFENQSLNKEEKKNIKEKIDKELFKVGTESLDKILEIYNEPKKQVAFKWQYLLKKIVQSKTSIVSRDYDSVNWIKNDRRNTLLNNDVMLPFYENEKLDQKYEIWFMQDVSGSVEHLASKFLNVAKSIPEKIFNIQFHTFDTATREVDFKKPKIIGGGGTNFQQIEDFIQIKIKKRKIKYPETILAISDGEGSQIKVQYPKNWTWILTNDNRSCLEKDMNVILIDEL